MRLATARNPEGGTRLYAARPDGKFFDVLAAAGESASIPSSVRDVGSLYRAGAGAEAAVLVLTESSAVDGASVELSELRLAPPVTAPGSIVCIGRNYVAHAQEGNSPVPEFPVLFSKFPNTLVGHEEGVIKHAITDQLDYEGELALVIGRRASRVTADEAADFVAGYTIVNDISARDLQLGDLQWIRGKSLDTFCPMGPMFVSADEIPEPGVLQIETKVNGELRQSAPASDMIFDIPTLIAFITQGITLEAGDIVATGTPSGVAFGMKPPVYLEPGDVVEVSVTGLGTLRSPIVEAN